MPTLSREVAWMMLLNGILPIRIRMSSGRRSGTLTLESAKELVDDIYYSGSQHSFDGVSAFTNPTWFQLTAQTVNFQSKTTARQASVPLHLASSPRPLHRAQIPIGYLAPVLQSDGRFEMSISKVCVRLPGEPSLTTTHKENHCMLCPRIQGASAPPKSTYWQQKHGQWDSLPIHHGSQLLRFRE